MRETYTNKSSVSESSSLVDIVSKQFKQRALAHPIPLAFLNCANLSTFAHNGIGYVISTFGDRDHNANYYY